MFVVSRVYVAGASFHHFYLESCFTGPEAITYNTYERSCHDNNANSDTRPNLS